MAVKNEVEEKMKKMLLDSVKELAEDKIPKAIPRAVIDEVLKEVEELLADVHIFK
jgi:hypothetical protein